MKNVIKITTLAIALTFLSAIVLSAQEHNMHKSEKTHEMMDAKKIDKNNDGIIYECPMKCEPASDKPGNCSKCGMKLTEVSLTDTTKGMKCDSMKKGCCCDKERMERKNEMMEKNEHMNHKMGNHSNYKSIDKNNDGIVYECPMKCEPATDKPGDCSKCGMKLKEVTFEKNH